MIGTGNPCGKESAFPAAHAVRADRLHPNHIIGCLRKVVHIETGAGNAIRIQGPILVGSLFVFYIVCAAAASPRQISGMGSDIVHLKSGRFLADERTGRRDAQHNLVFHINDGAGIAKGINRVIIRTVAINIYSLVSGIENTASHTA